MLDSCVRCVWANVYYKHSNIIVIISRDEFNTGFRLRTKYILYLCFVVDNNSNNNEKKIETEWETQIVSRSSEKATMWKKCVQLCNRFARERDTQSVDSAFNECPFYLLLRCYLLTDLIVKSWYKCWNRFPRQHKKMDKTQQKSTLKTSNYFDRRSTRNILWSWSNVFGDVVIDVVVIAVCHCRLPRIVD